MEIDKQTFIYLMIGIVTVCATIITVFAIISDGGGFR